MGIFPDLARIPDPEIIPISKYENILFPLFFKKIKIKTFFARCKNGREGEKGEVLHVPHWNNEKNWRET